MSEGSEEANQRASRELEGKNIAHYQVLLDQWLQTRSEIDRTLISVASGGVAVVAAILTSANIDNWTSVILFSLSVLCFLGCIWTCLDIFHKNAELLECEIRGTEYKKLPDLKKADQQKTWLFLIAIALAIGGGVAVPVARKLDAKEAPHMTEKEQSKKDTLVELKKSFDGVQNLKPKLEPEAAKPANQTTEQIADQSKQEGKAP